MGGAWKPFLPSCPLSAELQVDERLTRRVVPAGDVRPRRREELAQERLVTGGDRATVEPSAFEPSAVQFREGKMPSRAMM